MSTAAPETTQPAWDLIRRRALAAAGAGLALFAALALVLHFAGGVTSPLQFFLSYSVAYQFWLSIALGCLVLLMLQYLTGGAWGVAIRRVLESGAWTLLPLALLFLPLLLGLDSLYLWAQPGVVAHEEHLRHKAVYLNAPFFVARTVLYFAAWIAVVYWLGRFSREQDREVAPGRARRFRLLSAPGLVLYGATITFASIDWVMSLEPNWYSTIFPVLFATGQVLTGLAFAVAVVVLLSAWPPLSEVLTPAVRNDLGNLLLTFVMFWAYMSVSQFLLIWVGNLPEEIPWYLRRTRDGWQSVATVLFVLHFALPFLLLLSRDIKRSPHALAAVAVGLLVLRFIDLFWWIEPAYPHEGQYAFWLLDLAALVGLGGLWVWWFVGRLKARPLLPVHDRHLLEARNHD